MAIVTNARAGLKASRATIIQLRDPGATTRTMDAEALELVARAPVPVVVSSRCDVVLAAGAAGVNLPEHDISVAAARSLLGDRLIGRSVHDLHGAAEAEAFGADFVILGPIWSSPTHPGSKPLGVTILAEVARRLRIPVLAIGGVTRERIEECLAAGASGYAAINLFA
jgi:thiamine-phosphate pyrophosphorylase